MPSLQILAVATAMSAVCAQAWARIHRFHHRFHFVPIPLCRSTSVQHLRGLRNGPATYGAKTNKQTHAKALSRGESEIASNGKRPLPPTTRCTAASRYHFQSYWRSPINAKGQFLSYHQRPRALPRPGRRGFPRPLTPSVKRPNLSVWYARRHALRAPANAAEKRHFARSSERIPCVLTFRNPRGWSIRGLSPL